MKTPIRLAGIALVIGVCVALWVISLFARTERERDVQTIQAQLNLVADSRAEALGAWLRAQYDILEGLAQNQSLQIYTSVVSHSGAGKPFAEDPEQLDYLRILLTATAQQAGFVAPQATAELPANVNPLGAAGLALVDPQGAVIAATGGMPPIAGRLQEFLDRVPVTERGLLDLHAGPHDVPTLGFVVPVLAQQGESATTGVIARLVGLRPVDGRFFATLAQPGSTARTAESYLVRRNGNLIEYLSPLLDGSQALTKRLALDSTGLIDAEALANPGRFHRGRDYAARDAFAVSRRVAGTDWVLVSKIGRAEALAAGDARRTALISILIAVTVLVGAALVLVWRYATSVRAEEAARQHRLDADRFRALYRLLDTVSDCQPNPLFVADGQGTVTFANRRTAEVTGIRQDELKGHSLPGMLGHDRGKLYLDLNRQVLATGQPLSRIVQIDGEDGRQQVWRSFHHPLPETPDQAPAVLTTIEDLTDLVRERARRERNTDRLIEALVGLVDERDPDSAHQSSHVRVVARRLAEELGLGPELVETVGQAARLVNLGKIRIPRSLLTKRAALTEEELSLIRESLEQGPDLLAAIDFDGPVVPTLRQINEWVDGSGRPLGLSGEEILISARIVGLANAFVALISPRAFRVGKSFDEAEAILMELMDRQFDKRVVLSLLNYLDNKGGRETWSFMVRS